MDAPNLHLAPSLLVFRAGPFRLVVVVQFLFVGDRQLIDKAPNGFAPHSGDIGKATTRSVRASTRLENVKMAKTKVGKKRNRYDLLPSKEPVMIRQARHANKRRMWTGVVHSLETEIGSVGEVQL